jgi:class 3 adenylate cyclase/YHS domain-containing protein
MQGMEVDRTFAFVDLCGFTAYTETHGSAMATQMLASFRAATRDIASRRGVRIAKWLGDGAMVVGVEAQPVLEAFLEIENRSTQGAGTLALRYGITFGKAILFEGDDYIGSVVNLAKRLCDAADPHEILIGPGVEPYVPAWAECCDRGDLLIKGIDGVLRREALTLRAMAHPVLDPVCGLAIDPELAVGEGVAADGSDVVFCSSACQVTWAAAQGPGRF